MMIKKANRKSVKITSLLLAIFMIAMCFPLSLISVSSDDESSGDGEEFVPWTLELKEGDLSLSELKNAVLPESELPAIISASLAEEKNHVNRLYEQEPDEFTVMFQNRDGSKTTYVFSHPVKIPRAGGYVDMTTAQIQTVLSAAQSNPEANNFNSLSLSVSENTLTLSLGSDFLKSRLGNLNAEEPIMDYNIGKAEIYKINSNELANGLTAAALDITDAAREWATPGSNTEQLVYTQPEVEEDDGNISNDGNVQLRPSLEVLNPGDESALTVMTVVTSNIAGERALRGVSNQKFVSYENSIVNMRNEIEIPYSRWMFSYMNNSKYEIKPMSAQNMLVVNYENEMIYFADELVDVMTGWTVVLYSQNSTTQFLIYNECFALSNSGTFDYYGGYLVDGTHNLSNAYAWEFCNPGNGTLLSEGTLHISSASISNTEEDVIFTTVDDTQTISPVVIDWDPDALQVGNNTFTWHSTNSTVATCVNGQIQIHGTGIAQIYCKYNYNENVTSNRITVIVSDNLDVIHSGGMHLIRPYSDNSKLLTMNVGTNEANTLSLSTWKSKWNNNSQAFNITENVNSKGYTIDAVLAENQYYRPNFNVTNSEQGNLVYNSTCNDEKSNTISLITSNQIGLVPKVDENNVNILSENEEWHILLKNNKYYIVKYMQGTLYYLSYLSDFSSLTVTTAETNSEWSITFFGIEAPCIKQTTKYFCSVAASVQVLRAIGHEDYTGTVNLNERMITLNSSYGSLKGYNNHMTTVNGGHSTHIEEALDGETGGNNYECKSKANDNVTLEQFKEYISTSLNNGSPVIVYVTGSSLPHYPNDEIYAGHFICVSGYDSATGNVSLVDCTYVTTPDLYGSKIITVQQLYNAAGPIVYRANP